MRTSRKVRAAVASISITAGLALALPMATASAAPSKASLPVITVTMNGKAISVTGALQSGGVEVVSKVSKEAMGIPVFARLDSGVTYAQFFAAFESIGQDPNNIDGIGTIVFSPQANKGTSAAEVDLLPGNYVAVDIASSSAIPPYSTFQITQATSPATLPRPLATISSIEFAFRGPTKLRDGELVQFYNHGFLVHMIVGLRASSLKNAKALAALLKAGKDAKAEKLVTEQYGWDNLLTHNQGFQQVIAQKPGYWVIACFMNTQDGREHTQLGMERVIQIVK
jgi:biopolymer transport protein ExbD